MQTRGVKVRAYPDFLLGAPSHGKIMLASYEHLSG